MCRGIVSRDGGRVSWSLFRGDWQKEGALGPMPPADMRGSGSFQGMVEDGRWAGLTPVGGSSAGVQALLRRGDAVAVLGLQAL